MEFRFIDFLDKCTKHYQVNLQQKLTNQNKEGNVSVLKQRKITILIFTILTSVHTNS